MMNARTREALMRTHEHLVRHLEDLNDQIDVDGDRIKDHMVLDGLKDCVKTLCRLHEMLGEDKADVATAENAAAFTKVKAPAAV